MHDLDRVLFEFGETGLAAEGPQNEFLEILGEISGETPGLHERYEQSGESQEAAQSLETYETELATELLSVADEAELEQFLGNLVSAAAGAARGFASSPTGRQLGGVLKQAAKQALPIIGGAVGDWVRPGGSGATWGKRIGSAAGDMFGLELEGLSHEDRELEVARGFVRFANAAARSASRIRGVSPAEATRRAVLTASRQHAPGLHARLRGGVTGAGTSTDTDDDGRDGADSGRWVRRGGVVVLYGL